MKKITILSLDGGGIRGIIPCIILRYIEEQLQKHYPENNLGDYFDLVAGSSTGGLIASILLYPGEEGKSKYSIQKGLELYSEKGGDIFQVSFWEKLINPFGLFNEKISEEALETNLNDFFGNLELKELTKPCLITSYDIENRRAKLFDSAAAKSQETDNFLVKDICRATSAAPTYFKPAKIKSIYGQEFCLIDGGMFANNPALCAYAEARKMPFAEIFKTHQKTNFPKANDMILVSLGTGAESKPYSYKKMSKTGKIGWVSPIIDILMSSNAETVDFQLTQIYKTLGQRNQKNYYRINPSLKNAFPAMDNVQKDNIEALIQAGLCYIDENKTQLNQIAQKLLKNRI